MFSYFITSLAVIFWLFRLIVALIYTTGTAFIFTPINITTEVILLFITFACIIFIAQKKMIGAVMYLIVQCAYFGVDGYKNLRTILEGNPTNSNYISLIVSAFAVIIPILAIMNIGLSTGKKSSGKNKKTDWFYATTEHDREYDSRADRNQYKF